MTRRGHSSGQARARVIATLLATAGTALATRAAEEKSASAAGAASAQAQGEDSIAAAKREFEAVKRNPALQPKADVPRVGVPEFHGGSSPAPSAATSLGDAKTLEKQKKSANWLIEAMEKSDPRKAKERERGGLGDRAKTERDPQGSAGGALETESRGEPEKRDAASASEAASERKPANAADANPLASYLGQWMTPGDYALLKPGLDQSLASSAGGANGAVPSPVTAGSLVPGADGTLAAGIGASARGGGVGPAPRENPYLSGLNLGGGGGTLTPPGVPAASPQASASAPASTLAAPPAPVAAKPKVPDFAKQGQDDKYFKQLKRF